MVCARAWEKVRSNSLLSSIIQESQARASIMISSELQSMQRSLYHTGHSDQTGRMKPPYHVLLCTGRKQANSSRPRRPKSTYKPRSLSESNNSRPLCGSTYRTPNHLSSERSCILLAYSTKSNTAGVAAAPNALKKHAKARPIIYLLRELPRAFLTSELNCFVDDMKKPLDSRFSTAGRRRSAALFLYHLLLGVLLWLTCLTQRALWKRSETGRWIQSKAFSLS